MTTQSGHPRKERDTSCLTVCGWLCQMALTAACFATVAAVSALGQQSESKPYRITAVRAFLYLNAKDSLSPNIINNPDMGDLLNVPSDAVLITVELAGKPGDYTSGRKVRLTVKKPNGTVLLDRRQQIGVFNDDGKWFETSVLYEVYGAGWCDTLRIRAEILGQKEPSVMEKKIPFVCGE